MYNMLLSVKITFDSPARWRLSSPGRFEAGMLEKAKDELEAAMEKISGEKIVFVIEHAASAAAGPGPAAEETGSGVGPEVLEQTAGEAPEGRWQEAPEVGASDIEPELKKLSKVFHGSKITKVGRPPAPSKGE